MTIILVLFGILLIVFIIFSILRKVFRVSEAQSITPGTFELLEIQVRKSSEIEGDYHQGSLAAENLFASLHGLLREEAHLQEHFSFEMVATKMGGIRFYAAVPNTIIKYVEGQIYAQYPDAQIKVVSDYTATLNLENTSYEIATLGLNKDDYFPIKTFRDLEVDPLSSITSAIAQVDVDETMLVQYLVKPIGDTWQEAGHKFVNDLRSGVKKEKRESIIGKSAKIFAKEVTGIATGVVTGWFRYGEPTQAAAFARQEAVKLTPAEEIQVQGIENKLSKMGYAVEIRIMASAKTQAQAESRLRLTLASFQQFSSNILNTFVHKISINKSVYFEKFRQRMFEAENAFILNTEELGSVFHLPTPNMDTPNISWVYSRKTEPPANLVTKDCVYIGETVFRSQKTRFGLAEGDDRLRHMYVIGKSGTGKSTLFENMITQDIANGHGVGILDPHGDTIDKILDRIPDNRVEDVIYFDPSDTERPIGINLLQIDDPSQKNLLASGLVSAIKQQFDYSWGPRLEYILNYSVLTLLEVPGTTMLGITRLLEDQNYQRFILHYVKDPVVQKFWDKEFKEMKGNQKLVTESISPIQNKVNRFLASSTIRNILGQKRSTVDLWDAMNNKKIILMNLSKGKIGSDNANLLGALLVSRIQFYALQRAKISPEQRTPFYLYVDEFQNFATGSFEEILSESRKYKLGLYLTHQFTAQLPEDLLKAVYGNVGTIATFSVGAPDAKALASEFAPYFSDEDIISLERFEIYIKMMINGMTSMPFSGRILLPFLENEAIVPKTKNRELVIARSREKYGVDREYVEDKTKKWIEAPFDKGMAIALEYKNKNENPNNVGQNLNKEILDAG